MTIESSATTPTADSLHERFVAHPFGPTDVDVVCLGLETLAAESGSEAVLDGIAGDLRQRTVLHLMPLAVQKILQPDAIYQSDDIVDGRIYTVTEVRLARIAPDEVFDAIFAMPWSWWRRGRISGWMRTAEGGLRFVLWPAWLRSPARVGIDLSPPERKTETMPSGATSIRISSSASFFGDFDGPGRYEILGGQGVTILRSEWDGVQRQGLLRLMPAAMVLDVHLRAERGTLKFPFPAGTGFPGLIEHLGAKGKSSRD